MLTKSVQNLLNTVVSVVALFKLFQVLRKIHSVEDNLGFKKGTMLLHVLLLTLTAVASLSSLICYLMYAFGDSTYFAFYIAGFFEVGIDTLLQLMIGYVCYTMGTDTSMKNYKLLLIQNPDGRY